MKNIRKFAPLALIVLLAGCSSTTDTAEIVEVVPAVQQPAARSITPREAPASESTGTESTATESTGTEAAPTTPAAPGPATGDATTPAREPRGAVYDSNSHAMENCLTVTGDDIQIDADSGCSEIAATHPQTFRSLFDRDLTVSNCMWAAYSLDSEDYSEAYNLAWAEGACLPQYTQEANVTTGDQALESCTAVTGGVITLDGESASCEDLVSAGIPAFMEIFDRDIPTAQCMWDEYSLDAEQYTPEYNLAWAQQACL